jgi:hypothetical protein
MVKKVFVMAPADKRMTIGPACDFDIKSADCQRPAAIFGEIDIEGSA